MASSSVSPAMRTDRATTIAPRLITAISVVPPPISTIMEPRGWVTRSPAPIAETREDSISATLLAPASKMTSSTARRSTSLMEYGTQTMTRGRPESDVPAFCRKTSTIATAASNCAITPERIGRRTVTSSGVFPAILDASRPTASTSSVASDTATADGSRRITPLPFTNILEFAVPRSMPMLFISDSILSDQMVWEYGSEKEVSVRPNALYSNSSTRTSGSPTTLK